MKQLVFSSLVALGGVAVGGIGGAYVQSQPPAPIVKPVVMNGTVVVPADLPGATTFHVGAGAYAVPGQIAPGTYELAARGQMLDCSWYRKRDLGTTGKSTIASGQIKRNDRDQFITVVKTDRYLVLTGECTWTKQGRTP